MGTWGITHPRCVQDRELPLSFMALWDLKLNLSETKLITLPSTRLSCTRLSPNVCRPDASLTSSLPTAPWLEEPDRPVRGLSHPAIPTLWNPVHAALGPIMPSVRPQSHPGPAAGGRVGPHGSPAPLHPLAMIKAWKSMQGMYRGDESPEK